MKRIGRLHRFAATGLVATGLLLTHAVGCGSDDSGMTAGTDNSAGVTGPRTAALEEQLHRRYQTNLRRVSRVVRRYYAALGRRDPRACTRYVDAAFLHSSLGASRKAPRSALIAACKRNLAQSRGDIELAKAEFVRFSGDDAFVQVFVHASETSAARLLHLRFSRGRFRLHGIGPLPTGDS